MTGTWLPYALAYFILLTEIRVWRRQRKESTKRDRGSLWVVTILFSAGYTAAFLLRPSPQVAWGAWRLWAGGALTVAGTAFRHWSIGFLGSYFTVTVQTSADQKVVEAGPYRWIRHPSYTGGILAAAGVGVSLGGWKSLLWIFIPVMLGYACRIKIEEAALCEALGGPYRDYMSRTKRLIPYLI